MKKILIISVSAVLLAVTVLCFCFGASASSATVRINDVTAQRGDTVEFKISLASAVTVQQGGLSLEYDKNVLQFVHGECKANVSLPNFDDATEKSAFANLTGPVSLSGVIYSIKFKVLDTAKLGSTDVKFNLELYPSTTKDNPYSISDKTGTVKVCKFTAKNTASTYLKSSASCTTAAKYYYSCEDCGAKGTATFESGSALNHSWSNTYSGDATNHWYACTRSGCTAKSENAKHSGGEASCTKKAVCTVCKKEYGELAAHSFTVAKNDMLQHWNKCANCEETDTKQLHNFGDGTVCADCKYTLGAVVVETVEVTISIDSFTTTVTANKNGSVTVKAQDTETKIFKGWDIGGTVVSTEKTYTFAVSANTTITAIYENKAVETDPVTSDTTTTEKPLGTTDEPTDDSGNVTTPSVTTPNTVDGTTTVPNDGSPSDGTTAETPNDTVAPSQADCTCSSAVGITAAIVISAFIAVSVALVVKKKR